jgi:hypothetical protein
MGKQKAVQDFVLKRLGCTCPDKIFADIEDRGPVSLSSLRIRCIIIGNRLLIHIWYVKEHNKFKKNLHAMLATGKKQRDALGLHRFRAVLAADDDLHHVEREAESCFSSFADRDDRMHIHVVATVDLKGL